MTKKVLAIAYNKINVGLFSGTCVLLIGSIAEFSSKDSIMSGFIEINNEEKLVKKYKKLANVLIAQGLIKKNSKIFRLDEVFGFSKKSIRNK